MNGGSNGRALAEAILADEGEEGAREKPTPEAPGSDVRARAGAFDASPEVRGTEVARRHARLARTLFPRSE